MSEKLKNRIVVFGKGGVGKSTFSANLSAHYALRGMKVLHIGCDPKGDSTLFLLENMDDARTVMSWMSTSDNEKTPARVFLKGRLGIKCVEAGGPEAGVGCGGRGIARVLEYLEKWNVFDGYEFDVVVFDVLGDVVCGGFAAPLRRGFGNKVVIVVAEDEMSYFAANNIAGAVGRYRSNGVSLAGLVVNRRGAGDPRLKAETFADMIGAGILGILPGSEAIPEARRAGLTAVEFDRDCLFSKEVAAIADKLLDIDPASMPAPTPIDRNAFMRYSINPETFDRTLLSRPPDDDDCGCAGDEDAPVRQAMAKRPQKPAMKGESSLLRVSKGLEALSLMGGFMGKNPELGGMTLKTVEFTPDGSIIMRVESKLFGEAVLHLKPAGAGEADAGSPNFGVFLIEGKLSRPVARLLRTTAKRLGAFSLEKLREIYEEKEREQAERNGGMESMPDSSGAGSAEKWASFFAEAQFARNSGQMISYNIPISQITHRDVECAYATPPIAANEFNLCNYPWMPDSISPPGNGATAESASYETSLDETDIIMGGKEKLQNAVDAALEEMGERKVLLFSNTCVPVVAGEDVSSIVSETRCRCAAPVMYEGPENSMNMDPYLDFFVSLKKKQGFSPAQARANAVNVIGFPGCRGIDETLAALPEMGIEINARFLPVVDVEIFQKYRVGALSVFYPLESFRRIYEEVFDGEDIPRITPPAPFGMQKTMEWFRAVADALATAGVSLSPAEEAYESARDEWERLVGEARGLKVGIVVDRASMKMLSDPPRNYSMDLPALLAEMGLGVEYLMYSGGDAKAAGDCAIFSTPDELKSLLETSECGCFYSDYYFDARLVEAGKSQFSRQFFEPGFQGAIRTARRILDSCRLPFFDRYKKYF